MDEFPSSPLSDGEVNFLFWFIQGSIMIPETRWRLRRSWGFCSRHSWAHLVVETAFRHRYLLGPAILYEDLMGRAVGAFSVRGLVARDRLLRRLSSREPCMLCELKVHRAGRGVSPKDRLERGRDIGELKSFARDTRARWEPMVCGQCRRADSAARCRAHLLEDLRRGEDVDISAHRRTVTSIHDHLEAFHRSFTWEYRDTDSPEDRASIFSAVGWLSGWQLLLALMDCHKA